MKNRKLAIIPARGGSKRIPKKNIKDFFGKPIIAYSIETAIKSKLFDEVMVSTDNEEIAEVSKKYGAKVPFMRNAKNADDYAGLPEVIIEVLNKYKINNKQKFDFVCCILPTAPLISKKRLIEGYNIIKSKRYSTVTPVVEFSYPILRSLKFDNDNHLVMNWPQYLNYNTQDLSKSYHDSGMFYWVDYKNFIKERNLFSNNGTGIILDEMEVQDIDSNADWKLAELKYKLQTIK